MQYKIFTVNLLEPEHTVDELNRFLRGHKVLEVEKHLIEAESPPYWTFCVTYLAGVQPPVEMTTEHREKKDYKSLLDERSFEQFSRLRMVRKELAREDAVPAYAVFTDAELAEFAKLSELTEKEMLAVEGVGIKRVEKYGKALCERTNLSTVP